jgi:hypothetical protein
MERPSDDQKRRDQRLSVETPKDLQGFHLDDPERSHRSLYSLRDCLLEKEMYVDFVPKRNSINVA